MTSMISKQYTIDNVTTDTISITANGYADTSVSATKSGYTPIGVVGFNKWGGTGVFVFVAQSYIDGSAVKFQLKNTHTTNSASVTIRFYVLYEKA